MTEKQQLIVVTGGAGFIGTHLCERLLADGHKVISLDNYFTGSKENHIDGVDYREGHTKDIEKHIPESPDVIYHMGEYSRVAKSIEEPEMVWDLNVNGTLGVLEFWRKKGGKLIYAGSSTKSKSTSATDDPEKTGRDLSPYTWAKAANSELVANYGKWYSLPYAVVYFYCVYGPGERAWGNYGTVVETFRQNLISGKPHIVNAPGTQTRAFTHVNDTIEGIVCVGEKGKNDEYNICASDEYSIRELAEMFGGEIEEGEQTKTSRSSKVDSTEKLQALGWEQKHMLKDYIEEEKKNTT